eukprot:CAMPEP_0176400256 /NCGR_PEP_ID=MMETSP0126-20121128/47454_1 /TAXON_ID=141414 ORGANISM="Strombidinopsis acuminatum, Strain SPMC142" /NCGR_SAMPLE_ID=MMETSP0126 /ASSEMBLY_ACC=CAM_ASM_000229 /LENGTH=50 /DNA_ID=CAMNT_0017776407 /DNA_START=595 /DNA_END=747 /DNA_ORIENTATION=-
MKRDAYKKDDHDNESEEENNSKDGAGSSFEMIDEDEANETVKEPKGNKKS